MWVTFRTPWTPRINFTFLITIISRIGIKQERRDATFLRGECLEPAVAVRHRVARERDFAAHVNSTRCEQIVIFGITTVDVDHWRGHINIRGVRAVRNTDVLVIRVFVLRNRLFF